MTWKTTGPLVETGRTKGRGHQNRKKANRQPSAGGSGAASGEGQPRLSVVELWRAGTVFLLLLVVLHAFQSLTGKVLKHNVIIAGGKDKENVACLQGGETRPIQRGQSTGPADGTQVGLHC